MTPRGDGALLLAGGRDADVVFDDLWLLTAGDRRWVRADLASPGDRDLLCRSYHAAVWLDGCLWLHGGKASTGDGALPFRSDLVRVALSDGDGDGTVVAEPHVVEQVDALGPRAYHTAVVAPCGDIMTYGGYSGAMFIDVVSQCNPRTGVWRHSFPTVATPSRMLSHASWSLVAPCGECGAATACVHQSKRLQSLPFLYSTACRAYQARSARTSIPPRDAAPLVRLGDSTFLFGGEVMQTFFDATIQITPGADGSCTWAPLGGSCAEVNASDSPPRDRASGPVPRAYHCSWALGGRSLAVWGGFALQRNSPKVFNDFTAFDPHSQEWVAVEQMGVDDADDVPAPRASAAVAPTGGLTAIMFGGDDGATYYADTWEVVVDDEFKDVQHTLRAAAEAFLNVRLEDCL